MAQTTKWLHAIRDYTRKVRSIISMVPSTQPCVGLYSIYVYMGIFPPCISFSVSFNWTYQSQQSGANQKAEVEHAQWVFILDLTTPIGHGHLEA